MYDLSKAELEDGMYIHCETKDQVEDLLIELDERGYSWESGDMLTENIEAVGEGKIFELCLGKTVVFASGWTNPENIIKFTDLLNLSYSTSQYIKPCNNEMSEERENELIAKIKDSGNRREFETGAKNSVTRKSVLEQALQTVTRDREEQYGTPENSFKAIAGAWSWYLDKEITAKDVAVLMCLFKSARVKTGRFKEDNWIDLIGYAACGAELEGME